MLEHLLAKPHVRSALRRARDEIETSRAMRPFRPLLEAVAIRRWEGVVPMPHAVKVRVIRGFAERFGCRVFVETGTWRGDTIDEFLPLFSRLYTIELDPELHRRATHRFRRDRQVTCLQGDSGSMIRQVLSELREPALFWLDAHYSGGNTARGTVDTPVLNEMSLVLDHNVGGHVVLIDDAREFGTNPAYPTIPHVFELARSRWPDAVCTVDMDIIRIHRPV